MKPLMNLLVKPLSLAAIVAAPMTTALVLTPTELVAQKGGNGNGNGANRSENQRGNGKNSDSDRQERRESNGRGAIASELKGLNAAHASPTALANASPNSMPGKLSTYQQSMRAITTLEDQAAESASTYQALLDMGEDGFAELNPDLNYAETLAAYEANYQGLQSAIADAEAESGSALEALTGGATLSDAAMEELLSLLNL